MKKSHCNSLHRDLIISTNFCEFAATAFIINGQDRQAMGHGNQELFKVICTQ